MTESLKTWGPESFARTLNDLDGRLPKSRSRCFEIGQWGGCGVNCPAFLDGECDEPQEIPMQEIVDEHGTQAGAEINSLYPNTWSQSK